MCSSRPKVLHTVLGVPMLRHVLRALAPVFGESVWVVVGHEADMVRQACADQPVRFVEQGEQLGTGHALMVALPHVRAAGVEKLLVINGDTPLISGKLIEGFLHDAADADFAFATLTLPEPGAFGRVVRRGGAVAAIIEARDYDPSRHGPEPREINAGLYLIKLSAIAPLLPYLTRTNKNGEYYLTDLVALAAAAGIGVSGLDRGGDSALMGLNTPAELAESEENLRRSIVREHLAAGVIMHGPDSIRIGPDAVIEPGAELSGPCELFGTSRIASGARVASHCYIRDSVVGACAVIHNFCHLEDATVGADCLVGPFARLRPGTVMEEGAHVGNFVELKKARLGQGAKANHLTYLGDADVGAGTNVGAGTITCNYDGLRKHQTLIGAGAFIGSNTALVAPVRIGDKAVVGAGTTVTKDVPEGHLGITRAPQKNLRWHKK
jgi:bifunctional UDP-N-acetylglucosamine pyrophosphorylase/glucosamine-1-phosphate N-acetyltransferase